MCQGKLGRAFANSADPLHGSKLPPADAALDLSAATYTIDLGSDG